MDRRDFLKYGSIGAAGIAVGNTGALDALAPDAAFAATSTNPVVKASEPWKFGVMADTQWPKNTDGLNPGSCAVGIINLLNAQFAHHGVEFVIQVGDLIDKEADPNVSGARAMPVRAQAAEALYDCGIGFFPLRGNHESSRVAATEFQTLYPQAQGIGSRVFNATNFSSPFASLNGLSYSFDYNDVRFVLIDQFVRTDGSGDPNVSTNRNAIDQIPWIDSALSGRAAGTHAFVFAHKNLIGQNHVDCLFGENPAANASARNDFIGSLAHNGVRYFMGGHDHMHHRSIVGSPNGAASVKQVVCASNSYKFYTPFAPQYPATIADGGYEGTMGNDVFFDSPAVESVIGQELYSIGYYIYTVDGPRVTVDFYSSNGGAPFNTLDGHALTTTPTGTAFYRRDSWGYSLNGKEFVVAEGGSYAVVKDAYNGTTAEILGGGNGSATTGSDLRKTVKTVNTGWNESALRNRTSYALSLWGMNDNLALWDKSLTDRLPASAADTLTTDTFTLQMGWKDEGFGLGSVRLLSRRADGAWVDTVDLNTGGTKTFVNGPWDPTYGLGTWGVDKKNEKVWAVINHEGDFVVTRTI